MIKKVIYNIGTEILLTTSNLHNAALIAQFSELLVRFCTKFRDENDEIGPSAVAEKVDFS